MTTNRLVLALGLTIISLQVVMIFQQQGAATVPVRNDPHDFVREAPEGTELTISALPTKGSADAAVALVEFSDYECPFCMRHAALVGRHLDRQFVESGKVMFAFANHPLPFHPNARFFAKAALCAGNQGLFWQMHDLLFGDKPQSRDAVITLAERLQLKQELFGRCLETDAEVDVRIEGDIALAKTLGFEGTPAFAIGKLARDGKVRVDKLIFGAAPLEVFTTAITQSLAE